MDWTPEMDRALGTATDTELATLWGIPRAEVVERRKARRIARYSPGRADRGPRAPRAPRTCGEDGCARPVWARGKCAAHAAAARATGSAPLRASTPIARKTPIVAKSPTARATPKKRRAPKPGVTPDTRAAVLARAAGRCEACGNGFTEAGVHVHHRKKRSQGGGHDLPNLVALHPDCHVIAPGAVHQRSAWAYEVGLMVRRGEDPAAVPLLLHGRREVLLAVDEPAYLAVAAV